jgi:hypothetical protein
MRSGVSLRASCLIVMVATSTPRICSVGVLKIRLTGVSGLVHILTCETIGGRYKRLIIRLPYATSALLLPVISLRLSKGCCGIHLSTITTILVCLWSRYSLTSMAKRALAKLRLLCLCVLRLIASPANLVYYLLSSEQPLQASLLATLAVVPFILFFDCQLKIRHTSYCLLVTFTFFKRSSGPLSPLLLIKSLWSRCDS